MKSKIIEEIIEYGKLCGLKNFTPGYSGNISARYNNNILITTSGSSNGYLKNEDIVEIDYTGNSLESGKKPSSEKYVHIEFYKQRPDINCIIHVHPPFLSAFASAGKDLMEPIMAENVFYFGGIPLAEYGLPSSQDLVVKTAKYFKDYDAILMANHGFIIGSPTMNDAYQKLELAESYAQTVINTIILGGAVLLTNNQVNDINSLKTK